MKVPRWVQMYFRKLPKDFTGQVTVDAKGGGITAVKRLDYCNEEIFYQRFRELTPRQGESHESGTASNVTEWTTD